MKIAVITDQHWGCRGDSREFLRFFEKCYSEFIVPYLIENDIKIVFDLGDTFDRRKYVNFLTLKTSKKFWFDPLEQHGIQLHSLVGNHTIYYRNTNEVNTMELVLDGYSNATVYSEPTEITIDGCDILMMPWINPTNESECFDIMRKTKAQVMFGHLEIKGFEMYRGTPSHEGYDESLFQGFDVVASGHFHKKSTKGNIHYLGAPYEMTWGDYNCPRGFHVFDTDKREFSYVENPFRMFHKIEYNDESLSAEDLNNHNLSHLRESYVKIIVRKKTNPVQFDTWLSRIYEEKPIEVTIVDDQMNSLSESIADSDIVATAADDTPMVIRKYIDTLGKRVDIEKLNNLMQNLYSEALNLEMADG
jgi:DNA repair exonuclease SbcCD nuclease subunit